MTAEETLEALIYYNSWRRGDDKTIGKPQPTKVGKTIESACELIEKLIEIQTNQTNGKTN